MAQSGQGYYPAQQSTQQNTQASYVPPQESQYAAAQPMYHAPTSEPAAPEYSAPPGPPPQAAGQMGHGEAGKYYSAQREQGTV